MSEGTLLEQHRPNPQTIDYQGHTYTVPKSSMGYIRLQPAGWDTFPGIVHKDVIENPAPEFPQISHPQILEGKQWDGGRADEFNNELKIIHSYLSSPEFSPEGRMKAVAQKLVEYVVFGHQTADYDRPSHMSQRYWAAKESFDRYYGESASGNTTESAQNYLRNAFIDYYQQRLTEIDPSDSQEAPFIWVQCIGPSHVDTIQEGNTFRKIFLDEKTAQRTKTWNLYMQKQLQEGHIDEVFALESPNPKRAAAKLADGHLLDMGNYMMVEVSLIKSRLTGEKFNQAGISERWDVKGIDPWVKLFITSHIKDGTLVELAREIGDEAILPDSGRLNAENYVASYRNLLALMEHPLNKLEMDILHPSELIDRQYIDLNNVYSYETWIYDPQLIVYFPEQGIAELAAIAGEIVEIQDASDEQIALATKSEQRRQAYEDRRWKPQQVARRISIDEMKKVSALSPSELAERIHEFKEEQIERRSEFTS